MFFLYRWLEVVRFFFPQFFLSLSMFNMLVLIFTVFGENLIVLFIGKNKNAAILILFVELDT